MAQCCLTGHAFGSSSPALCGGSLRIMLQQASEQAWLMYTACLSTSLVGNDYTELIQAFSPLRHCMTIP